MHYERPPLAVRPQVGLELFVRGRRFALALERHRQKSGGLVDDDQHVVLMQDLEIARFGRAALTPRAPGPVYPDTDHVAAPQERSRVGTAGFGAVDEYLASLERRRDASARSEPLIPSQKLVEPHSSRVVGDRPPCTIGRKLSVGLHERNCTARRCAARETSGRST